jgi:hypothetical protein
MFDLNRYAGWLAKDNVSFAVRADVKALAVAMDAGAATSELLLALDNDIQRLPGGAVRQLLRKALAKIRCVVHSDGRGPGEGDLL